MGKIEEKEVSMVQLLARPELFDGKSIEVVGVGNYEFESDRLFLCREHFKFFLVQNSIALEANLKKIGKTGKQLKEMNGKYVIVKGVFKMDARAHFSGTNPALLNVTRWDLYKKD